MKTRAALQKFHTALVKKHSKTNVKKGIAKFPSSAAKDFFAHQQLLSLVELVETDPVLFEKTGIDFDSKALKKFVNFSFPKETAVSMEIFEFFSSCKFVDIDNLKYIERN